MKPSLVAAVLAGGLMLAPAAAAPASPEPATPVGCSTSDSLPCDPFGDLLKALISGSSSLSGRIA
ncbi:hypothetical protein AB0H76_35185 [Nocardia sp. NPDC050712]|uniref:hypothetical protein n=1 Tax=Nocardia sp. NPDC050712 TaxID=3155518 RepID=UPI0033D5FE75